MRERIIFIARYYFSLVALAAIYKAIFLLADSGEEPLSVIDSFSVIYYGLQHDLAVAGYFTSIPLLVAIGTIVCRLPLRRFLARFGADIS